MKLSTMSNFFSSKNLKKDRSLLITWKFSEDNHRLHDDFFCCLNVVSENPVKLFSLLEIRLFCPMRVVGGLYSGEHFSQDSSAGFGKTLHEDLGQVQTSQISWLAVGGGHQEEGVTTGWLDSWPGSIALPCPWMYLLPTIPTVGTIFKDTALRVRCCWDHLDCMCVCINF